MARLSQRVTAITPSATLAVDAKAKALKAQGIPVISFGAGEPDFPTPEPILEAARRAVDDPRNHRYSPAGGLPELRDAIAAKTKRDSGLEVPASQVVVTNGGKHAVYNGLAVLLNSGDEVLLPAPYWTTYPEAISLAGGVVVEVPTARDEGFLVTVEQLEAVRTARTKALVFVSPSNPTGAVYPTEQVEAIGRWAVENDVWVITDEIYEHLTYADNKFSSMPAVVPEVADRCVVINGVAKTYAMTGWRVGWLIGPPDVAKAAVNLQSHQTSNVSNVAQQAALAAVSGPLDAVAEMRAAFDRRGQTIYQMLNAIYGVICLRPQGAFYVFPSFEGVLGHRGVPDNTSDLAEWILDQAHVAIVPGEAFSASGYARLSFALGDNDLVEGIGRIADLLA
ncbi:MAG: pyridoxal phosphate-dependent aminotransferase [Acidimicrobiia bacterium]|nr:pyridoxal phosphate-dependent aminotransferase [Acidimicrobiia bacterium]MYC58411.1 pyridoxal phosphate-dependent aminotransferase [Acidimicrobiia bacterium]MYG94170.1 pyridoxal phosphate-dependent aminotransferase [Acidimicrobiia bacterium]MYI30483.1 pyridoxal phosphate-dependent aminotransferase [Acidimicrobiia bacterium]